jgi:hypothetical protein
MVLEESGVNMSLTISQTNKSTVEKLIYKMLTTSTGMALCDSGGADGRNWQRNQKKTLQDFRNELPVSVEVGQYEEGEIFYTISLFHYLKNGLELDALSTAFNRKPVNEWDSELYGVSQKGYDWLMSYGFKIGRTFNSYNGDSALSQVIQGTWLTMNERDYLLLQIHQGADVRGGYTDAKLFYCPEYQNGALSEDVHGTVTRANGDSVQVSNIYDGWNITEDESPYAKIKMGKGDNIELFLSDV